MAFIDLKFFSEALGMQTEVYVLIPQKGNYGEIGVEKKAESDKYKCLYLLHGLSDDQSIWMRRTSIERYADKYGICVVMPCAAKSFYTDMKYGMNYYTYIAKELPARIREFFNVSDKREDNFVAGLSMGGYGALKIALRECGSFAAGAGLSAAIDMELRKDRPLGAPIFGENCNVPPEDDLYYLALQKKDAPDRPKLYLGIGTEDILYGENQKFKEVLTKYNYDFVYRESAGSHTWEFWDEYIQYVLEWMFGNK